LKLYSNGYLKLKDYDACKPPTRSAKPVSAEEILNLAARCEWAEIDDMSDTPYAKQGFMHPACLQIGWGHALEAYKKTNPENSGVCFFNAYYQ
jgi:hypothetical protein